MLAPPRLGHCSNELGLARTPAAARLVAGVDSGCPRPDNHHHSTHRRASFPESPAKLRTKHHSSTPSTSAAPGHRRRPNSGEADVAMSLASNDALTNTLVPLPCGPRRQNYLV